MPLIRRTAGERFEVTMDEDEARVLAALPAQVRELITQSDGAVHERLFPRVYLDPTEEEAEREWQRLMHADLLEERLAGLQGLEADLASAHAVSGGRVVVDLTGDALDRWLRVLNDIRLALGVLLEVTEDLEITAVDPSDPRGASLHLYGWLTWFQGELVEAANP